MISFELNGEKVQSRSNPCDRLLDVLRGEFNLTGPKEGCKEGECGACSVLIDGVLVNSCITPLGNINNKKVMTIEGFKKTERYKILSKTFAEAGAVQCGFCTPGMIMAAESLLSQKAKPTVDDIKESISGNLCRCTGYNMIIDGVLWASKQGEGLW